MRLLLLVLAAMLAACTPDLDWRELRPPDAGFSAWMPSRTMEDARPLAGRPGVQMHQWSARARDTVFAVGYADFPQADAGALREVRDALVANIGGRVESEHAVASGYASGVELRARGERGGPLLLRLRLLARGSRLYLAATLGKPGDLDDSELDTFFDAFKIEASR